MHVRNLAALVVLASIFASAARAQLVWNTKMDKYSAILPLTLEDDVYRVRAKPPEGVLPIDINCDIGITGTVLTDQRGTSAGDPGQKVLSSLMHYDDIDVEFSDRVFTGRHTYTGDRVVKKYDIACGINVQYQNKKKVAQLELRAGYVLPSGDREGLTWSKLRRKVRQLNTNINTCDNCRNVIGQLEAERGQLQQLLGSDNYVARMRAQARLSGIGKQISAKARYASRRDEFERDLNAFASLEEYLRTKVNGCQVYVHFHHQGKTLSVDIDELRRSRIRPIQVFEETKDPIKHPELPGAVAPGG